MKTLVALISFLIIPSANTAASGNKGGGLNLYLNQFKSKSIEKIYLPYFKTLEAHVNNNAMKQAINSSSGNISFNLEKLGFDYDALDLSINILLNLCDIDLKKINNTNSVERINNCMDYFSQKNKNYLATTLLTAYEVGEFLGAEIIIQRAIVNRIYDKIFHATEIFDYERFEKYLINPKDFDKEISERKTSSLITLSNKNLRSANLLYITTELNKQSENVIWIILENNKIQNIKPEELNALKEIAFKKKIKIYLSLKNNPLLPETQNLIEKFNNKLVDKSKIQNLKEYHDLEIKNLEKKVFASLTAISIFSLLTITQLLKKASPLIGLVRYKKLQMGIKLGSYLLPLSELAYLHYQLLKNEKKNLNSKSTLNKSTFTNEHVIISY